MPIAKKLIFQFRVRETANKDKGFADKWRLSEGGIFHAFFLLMHVIPSREMRLPASGIAGVNAIGSIVPF